MEKKDRKWDKASMIFHTVRNMQSGDGIEFIIKALRDEYRQGQDDQLEIERRVGK